MKILYILLIISTISILPQENPFSAGTVELNLNADFGTVSIATYQAYFISSSLIGTDDSKYALIEFRSGVFLFDKFSLETDFGFHFLQHSAPSFYIVPNLSHSFLVNKWLGLYLRAGLGYSNSAALFGVLYKTNGVVLSKKLMGAVLNLGTGGKFFITDDFAIRTELNYKFAQQELHEFGIGWANLSNLSVTFGISFFL